MSLSLSKKQKKELKKLRKSAAALWEKQQELAGEAGKVARKATRQAGEYGRKKVIPTAQSKYHDVVDPYVDIARPYAERGYKASKKAVDTRIVPAIGSVAGRLAGAYDAARAAAGRPVTPPKKKRRVGPVVAVVLGVAAAAGIVFAAWQTLRADDELWVADDPLSAPDA